MKPKKQETLLVLILVLSLGLWAFWPKHSGREVRVAVAGEDLGTFSLTEPIRREIAGYGGYQLTLCIEGGRAWVDASTCPDLICQHHAPISKTGQQIICLPARVVISISGEEAEVDAITE